MVGDAFASFDRDSRQANRAMAPRITQRDDQHGGASRHAGRQRAGLIETDRTDAQQTMQRSTTAC